MILGKCTLHLPRGKLPDRADSGLNETEPKAFLEKRADVYNMYGNRYMATMQKDGHSLGAQWFAWGGQICPAYPGRQGWAAQALGLIWVHCSCPGLLMPAPKELFKNSTAQHSRAADSQSMFELIKPQVSARQVCQHCVKVNTSATSLSSCTN